jgi:hypothetical protein
MTETYPEPLENLEFLNELRIIQSKPEGQRIDDETLAFIRKRLADLIEEDATDPNLPHFSGEGSEIELLRKGEKIKSGEHAVLHGQVAKLMQDYRFTPEERDVVRSELSESPPASI